MGVCEVSKNEVIKPFFKGERSRASQHCKHICTVLKPYNSKKFVLRKNIYKVQKNKFLSHEKKRCLMNFLHVGYRFNEFFSCFIHARIKK
jgi:hypothetical protein